MTTRMFIYTDKGQVITERVSMSERLADLLDGRLKDNTITYVHDVDLEQKMPIFREGDRDDTSTV